MRVLLRQYWKSSEVRWAANITEAGCANPQMLVSTPFEQAASTKKAGATNVALLTKAL